MAPNQNPKKLARDRVDQWMMDNSLSHIYISSASMNESSKTTYRNYHKAFDSELWKVDE